MKVMPIRYAQDVAASTEFYRALGLEPGSVSRPGGWSELTGSAGMVAVHAAEGLTAGRCELCFEADEPLETVAGRLRAAGFSPDDIVDESFGRSLQVRDPDGVLVQVNEHERELYTRGITDRKLATAGAEGTSRPAPPGGGS
jgi:catechol 2,3-dioxygenase-like lactoylglutathione lyase family enzyme